MKPPRVIRLAVVYGHARARTFERRISYPTWRARFDRYERISQAYLEALYPDNFAECSLCGDPLKPEEERISVMGFELHQDCVSDLPRIPMRHNEELCSRCCEAADAQVPA